MILNAPSKTSLRPAGAAGSRRACARPAWGPPWQSDLRTPEAPARFAPSDRGPAAGKSNLDEERVVPRAAAGPLARAPANPAEEAGLPTSLPPSCAWRGVPCGARRHLVRSWLSEPTLSRRGRSSTQGPGSAAPSDAPGPVADVATWLCRLGFGAPGRICQDWAVAPA